MPVLAGILFLLAVALVASRYPLVQTVLQGSEITTDEPDLTQMSLDRFFGAPLTNTHWPALTNQMFMVPAIAIDYLVSGEERTVGGFAAYAGRAYRDSSHLMYLHRWIVVVLVSVGTIAVAVSVRRFGWIAPILAVLVLQNIHLITYGTLGLGNGPALAAMLLMFAVLVGCRDPKRQFVRFSIAGLLMGLAVSSRNTSVLALPIVAGFLFLDVRSVGGWVGRLVSFGVGALLGSITLWSSAALDPFRWAKANLGNFVKIGEPAGATNALWVLMESTGPNAVCGIGWWLLTAIACAWLLLANQLVAVVVGFLIASVLAIVISAGSPLVETRYFDAIVLGSALMILFAMLDLLTRRPLTANVLSRWQWTIRSSRVVAGMAIGMPLLLAMVGVFGAQERFDASKTGLRPVERQVAASLPAADGIVIIDRSLLAFIVHRATPDALVHIADGTERSINSGIALREFVEQYKLPPRVAQVFASTLTEKEQMEVIRKRVAACATPIGAPIDVMVCGDTVSARRYGAMPVAAAIDAVRSGIAAEAILVPQDEGWNVSGLVVESVWQDRYVRVRRASNQASK